MGIKCDAVFVGPSYCSSPAKWALSYLDIPNVIYRCDLAGTNLTGLVTAIYLPTGNSFSGTEVKALHSGGIIN